VKRRKRRAPARLLVLSPFSTSEFGFNLAVRQELTG